MAKRSYRGPAIVTLALLIAVGVCGILDNWQTLAHGELAQPLAEKTFTEVQALSRGKYFARSQRVDGKALGGFWQSENAPKHISKSDGKQLALVAEPDVEIAIEKLQGMRVMLLNPTNRNLELSACDSNLSLIQEAQDDQGVWKPIEYTPQSWCGNSYHSVVLLPGHYWEFAAPRYKGPQQTKLRFALKLDDGQTLYSNVFAGSIDPKQFIEKKEYKATNIMDPYNE